jgi:hypothetical protein
MSVQRHPRAPRRRVAAAVGPARRGWQRRPPADYRLPVTRLKRLVFGEDGLKRGGLVGLLVLAGSLTWVLDVPGAVVDLFEGDPAPVTADVEIGPPTVERLPGGGALRFAANETDYIGVDGMGYIVPGPIRKVGKPPTDRPTGWRRWAYEQGGMDAPATTVRVTLRGNRDAPVAILDLEPVIERRLPVERGIRVKGQPSGCGPGERELRLSLDDGTITPATPGDAPPYEIGTGEHEFLHVIAFAGRGAYGWRLRVRVQAGDRKEWLVVDDGGRPFLTSALGEAKEWAWEPVNPAAPNPRFEWRRSGPPC